MGALRAEVAVDGPQAEVYRVATNHPDTDGKHRSTASIYNVQTKNAISDFKLLPRTSRVFSLI